MKDIYTTGDGRQFEIVEEYTQEQDAWVRYQNTHTKQEYTARKEAFLARTQRQIIA